MEYEGLLTAQLTELTCFFDYDAALKLGIDACNFVHIKINF